MHRGDTVTVLAAAGPPWVVFGPGLTLVPAVELDRTTRRRDVLARRTRAVARPRPPGDFDCRAIVISKAESVWTVC